MKRLLTVFIAGLIFFESAAAAAKCAAAVQSETAFSVTERNGTACNKYLIKRGFPFKMGEVLSTERFIVKDTETNEKYKPNLKVMETYDNCNVKWLMVAFTVDLKPYETKNFVLKKGDIKTDKSVNCKTTGEMVVVSNGVLSAEFDAMGLKNIEYSGKDVMAASGMQSYSEESNEEKILQPGKIEIVEEGADYVILKISADYKNGIMRAEKTYTITGGASKISCSTRTISYNTKYPTTVGNGADYINSLYDKFYFNDTFTTAEYSSEALKGAHAENPIYSCDYTTLYSNTQNIGVAVVSKDVEKFRGAFSGAVCNGFFYNDNEKSLVFAPVIYKNTCHWDDGFSRTTHCEIVLFSGRNADIGGVLKTQVDTPEVKIDTAAFVKAGILASERKSPAAMKQMEEIKWTKDKRGGRLDAGSIPFGINSEQNYTGLYNVHLGEITYNIWFGAMATGDGTLFDIVNEGTESWADCMIYRGCVEGARGFGRYRVEEGNNWGHAYYSEFSNLYIAYLMTGDLYYYDSCREMAEAMYRSGMSRLMSGYHMVRAGSWARGWLGINASNEIRCSFQIRSMQNAYNLFKDQRYSYIASEIGKWTSAVQQDDGSWIQYYDTQGNGIISISTWYLYKNYLMLYGLRGHCDYYKQTKDADMLATIIKFADYLVGQMGGRGWMYDPCSDIEKCEMGEDYSRGKAPMQELMATEIFQTVYEATGDQKYFKALCEAMRNYLASSHINGFSSQRFNHPDYVNGSINGLFSGQNLTLMRMDSVYCALFEKEEALAKSLGYSDLCAMFCQDSVADKTSVVHNYDSMEVSANLYCAANGRRYLYLGNNSGGHTGEWQKNIEMKVTNGAGIWTNVDNDISNPRETAIERTMDYFDTASCLELPVRLTSCTGSVHIYEAREGDGFISFKAEAENGEFGFKLTDGAIPLSSGCTIEVSGGTTKTVLISAGGGIMPQNGAVDFKLNFSDDNVFADTNGHWAENSIRTMYNAGVVKGVSDTEFAPERNVTLENMISFVMRAFGVNDLEAVAKAQEYGFITKEDAKNLTALVSREKAVDMIMRAVEYKNGRTAAAFDINEYKTVCEIADDIEAVNADMSLIAFANANLQTSIQLPEEGVYGSKITWQTDNEKYLTADGKVDFSQDGEKEVTLTANVQRGDAFAKKDFKFTIHAAAEVEMVAGSFDKTCKTEKISGKQAFSMVAEPNNAPVDFVIGFYNSAKPAAAFADFNMIVRFSPRGVIDAYNRSGYSAINEVNYQKGKKYKFDIAVDVDKGIYSVSVTDEYGKTAEIAKDYEFRSSAGEVGSLDSVSLIGGSSVGKVTYFTAAASEASGAFGYLDAQDYFGIQKSDVEILHKPGYKYYSTDSSVLNIDGKYIGAPKENKSVYLLGVPESMKLFNDFNQIDNEYLMTVLSAETIGIISEDENGRFNPKGICSRSEAAALLHRMCDIVGFWEKGKNK